LLSYSETFSKQRQKGKKAILPNLKKKVEAYISGHYNYIDYK